VTHGDERVLSDPGLAIGALGPGPLGFHPVADALGAEVVATEAHPGNVGRAHAHQTGEIAVLILRRPLIIVAVPAAVLLSRFVFRTIDLSHDLYMSRLYSPSVRMKWDLLSA